MTKTKELETRLDEIRDTLIRLEFLRSDINFISNKNSDYFKLAIEKSSFFYRVYQNSIRLFVIEIYKLLNPNEHFSCSKTLNFILSNRNQIVWKKDLPKKKIKELISSISNLDVDYIKNLKNLRDKHLTHSDKDKFEYETTISLIDSWETLEMLQNIFVQLNLHLLDKQYIFSLMCLEPGEFSAIARYRKIKNLVLAELMKGADIGKLQKVRDITLGKRPA
jgi:AbiU2